MTATVLGWIKISDPVTEDALVILLAKPILYLAGKEVVVLLATVGAGMC